MEEKDDELVRFLRFNSEILEQISEDVVNALLPLLQDENSNVRLRTALALSNLGNSSKDVVNALLPLLQDENSDVRLRVALTFFGRRVREQLRGCS
ncbi:HEAT repeat domain-containing protein [Okeania sp. KiyG1]|uniref:HEAT repeat domain-containing protein n=1 Tax=Okeania sp. KiyG1 TaxID=2720165 RepID=UPI001F2C693D|nr:HEAT repeat domain-containing protein [Okeania sp. KiyG1]